MLCCNWVNIPVVFLKNLQSQGYDKVDLIDTTIREFMTLKEAKRMMLQSSMLLVEKSDLFAAM